MLATHKGEIPFVVYILPFLAGISLALTFNLSGFYAMLTFAFGILLSCFFALNLFYQQARLYRRPWIGGSLLYAILLITGMIITLNYDTRTKPAYFAKFPADALLVKINNEPQFKNGFLRFTADAELRVKNNAKRMVSGALLVAFHTDSAHAHNLNYGDEILIPASYKSVEPPYNPAEFNYKQYLSHQNIYMQTFIDPRQVQVFNRGAGNPIVAYSLKLRQALVGQFKVYMHNPEAIAMASTLILGYKAELDNDILQAYSKTGTIHVLSVSGAHVAIIFVMIGWLLGFMDRYRYGKIVKAVLTILLIWYYSLLTGLSPAVCRAAVMISLVIIGNTFLRNINILNVLAVSAFAILLFDPYLITDVGFQLSYLAIIGLVVFQPIIYNWFDFNSKVGDWLWKYCSASIAIQAVTFPLSAYYFHQFPVYFLITNLLIILPVEIIMYAGIGCLGFAKLGLGFMAKFGGYILEKSILLMDWILQFIERSPNSSAGKIWLSSIELSLLSAAILLMFSYAYYKKASLLKVALVCTLILSVSLSAKRITALRSNSITFLNLKKHSGILFKQGGRAVLLTYLADTAKNFKHSIQPYLDSSRISALIIKPFDKDVITPFMVKRGHLIRFLSKDVLILDKATAVAKPASPQKIDYLFATGSPHPDVGFIQHNYIFNRLITDAGNSDQSVNALQSGLNQYDKKMYVLKRNKSLIVESD